MFRTFDLEQGALPASIYAGSSFRSTNVGAVLSASVRDDIEFLLCHLLELAGADEDGTYFRLDLYPLADGRFAVIEANAHFVDGWGTALALSRAAGFPVRVDGGFPMRWTTCHDVYEPELELAARELVLAGVADASVVDWDECLNGDVRPAYWYGRFRREGSFDHILPRNGAMLDDKIWLAYSSGLFGDGDTLVVPKCYWRDVCHWSAIPNDVVFKRRVKTEDRHVVKFRDQIGRGKSMRKAYERGEVLAQTFVDPFLREDRPVQFVVLCQGTNPITGYVQFADPGTRIINDACMHGPLIFT